MVWSDWKATGSAKIVAWLAREKGSQESAERIENEMGAEIEDDYA